MRSVLVTCTNNDSVTWKMKEMVKRYVLPYLDEKECLYKTFIGTDEYIREDIFNWMDENNPKFMMNTSHGASIQVGSPYLYQTFDPDSMERLRNRIFYTISCNTGGYLGWVTATEYGGSFAGFAGGPGIWGSGPVAYCLVEFSKAIIDGLTVKEAYQRTIDLYNYWIDDIIENDPHQSGITTLIMNRDMFVAYGNMNDNIFGKNVTDSKNITIGVIND